MDNKPNLELQTVVNPQDYEVGVIVARFQVHKLTPAHRSFIEKVRANHKKVIILLGVSPVIGTDRNPLDFATRKAMIENDYASPNLAILWLKDNRSNETWSKNLDEQLKVPFGERNKFLLYGGRDSFIPFYKGKHKTTELVTDASFSGTEVRKEVSREILESSDFRAGVIHSCAAQWPVAYPCVDIVAYNDKNQLLLAQKPDEDKWRFIGGHVDPTDVNLEAAAKREFSEETGGCSIDGLEYVCSYNVPDWRYRKEKSTIMTTLFAGVFQFGAIKPSDDISALKWFNFDDISTDENIENLIVEEHVEMVKILTSKIELGQILSIE